MRGRGGVRLRLRTQQDRVSGSGRACHLVRGRVEVRIGVRIGVRVKVGWELRAG